MSYILVEALPFCAQTRIFLMMSGIDTIHHLIEMSEEQISSMDGINDEILDEILSFKRLMDQWTKQGIEVRCNQRLGIQPDGSGYTVINAIYPETVTNRKYEMVIQNKDGEFVKDCLIDEMNVSKRLKNSLLSFGIISVRDVMDLDYDALSDIKKLGEKSKTELIKYLKTHTTIQLCA